MLDVICIHTFATVSLDIRKVSHILLHMVYMRYAN